MTEPSAHAIGTPGVPWGEDEKAQWLARQTIKRAYADEVLSRLEPLKAAFAIDQYGALSHAPQRYPLFAARSKRWEDGRPCVLITGGVHGYETSGVQGALRFMQTHSDAYTTVFNLVVAPCVSPWGYETINRWNARAVDPNRAFRADSQAEEAIALMAYLERASLNVIAHFDLHETTDTDNTEFRPALAARDAIVQDNWDIPDGFYTVGDLSKPAPDFLRAIIDSVEQVTHIAPTDAHGKIIGDVAEQKGVVSGEAAKYGLCMGVTSAPFVTTTEVYPDSPRVDDEICIQAQVAAVVGGLDYIRQTQGLAG